MINIVINTCPCFLREFVLYALCRKPIHNIYNSCDCFNPIFIGQMVGCHHVERHIHNSYVLSLDDTILLRCISCSELLVYAMGLAKIQKFIRDIFTTSIHPQDFHVVSTFLLHNCFELLKTSKCFRFMFQKINHVFLSHQ